jgi:hypothetical protein
MKPSAAAETLVVQIIPRNVDFPHFKQSALQASS